MSLDRNTLERMVRSALHQDQHYPELVMMAQRLTEPEDTLARWLVTRERPAAGDPLVKPETFEYMLEICRSVACYTACWMTEQLCAPGHEELTKRWGEIGQFPTDLPQSGDDAAAKWFLAAINMVRPWMYMWWCNPGTAALIREDWFAAWRLHTLSNAFIVYQALGEMVRFRYVEVPEKSVLTFCLHYGKWQKTCLSRPTLADTCCPGLLYSKQFNALELQRLAFYWDDAAQRLARQHIPLAKPTEQAANAWVDAVVNEAPCGECELEKGAALFKSTTCKVTRAALWRRYGDFRGPARPFGPEVALFAHHTGQPERPPMPTYDEAVAFMLQLIG